MFDGYDVTGDSDWWIAVPDGFKPSPGNWKRTAVGERAALQMMRDAAALMRHQPKRKRVVLYINYSAPLANNRDIAREIDKLKKDGPAVGFDCDESVLAERA